jgi:hypothetical protein
LQRLEYPLSNGILEWWENRNAGLEQGWTIAESPAGDGLLTIHLEVQGANIAVDPTSVHFATAGGLSLRSHTLIAKDAAGHDLPAHFAENATGVAVVVDDRNARYPIHIDPVYQAFFWSAESNQVGSNFGFSVAGAGDVDADGFDDVLVGAYLYDNGNADEGAAFLYLGTALGPSDEAAWSAEGDQNTAYFGYSVAGAGDVNGDGKSDVIVGAYLYDAGQADEGQVFVYHGTDVGSGVTDIPTLTIDVDQPLANFGLSVAGAGDVNKDGYDDIIVGAPSHVDTLASEGAAYVFLGSSNVGLSDTPTWFKPGGQDGANFGQAVAGAGDINNDGYDDVIVGAYRYQDAVIGPADEGGAFVYLGSASGPSSTAVWTAEGNQTPAADFGYAVAGAGDVNNDGFDDILVGARGYDAGQADEGRAYLYLGSLAGPSVSPAWTGESNLATANFGTSVAAAGDVNNDGFDDFLIGAPLADGSGQADEGRSYLYLGSNSGVQATSYVTEGDQAGAKFGRSVAGAGDINNDGYDDVIIGASEFTMGQSKEGRALVYMGSEAGLGAQIGVWTAEGGQTPSPAYGYSVAGAGDVNNDGFDDVIVGAYQYDHGHANEGGAFAFYGSRTGLATVASWTAESDQANANFGQAVAAAGDINNDGFDDVIVGARLFDRGGYTDEGAAFVYRGSATGLNAAYAWTAAPNQAAANFGVSVAGAGDVNGDGFDDVIVGANLYDNGEAAEGIAFVYKGSASGLGLAATWSGESNKANSGYGYSVASAGDVNNDGFDDVIVGAPQFNDGITNEGKAFVYLGSSAGLDSTAVWTAKGGLSGINFGYSVASAGRVNGDAFDDLIVGAPKYSNGQTSEGRAFVFHGSGSGPAIAASWTGESDQASSQFAESVASAGDVNGDGFGDVVVGASLYDNGETDEGGVFVYLGDTGGLADEASIMDNDQASSNLGLSVAGAGDVNADGYDDIITGAQKYDGPGLTDQGRVYVFLGSACVGADGIDEDGDGFLCPFDCDDSDIDVYPGAGDATCDGIDDDCSGTQDEDYAPRSTSCGDGVCERNGTTSCALGVESDSCVPGLPTAADDVTCDGVDEDCSGDSDEDYVSELRNCGLGVCASTGMSSCALGVESDNCTPGTPTAGNDANCNTIDEDCSGQADEDYPETPTTCGVGACASMGAIDCINGSVGDTCVIGTPAPSDTTCDGIDDDCDTFEDEDYVSELRHCGFGVCDSTGMSSCSLGIESDNCTPGAPTAANDANCNTVDEDCSGEADEDYVETPTSCGTQGACAATGAISCISGTVQDTCTPGTPAANDDSCNGIDDDCDGNSDEDAVCSDAGADAGLLDAGASPASDASSDSGSAQGGSSGQNGNAGRSGSNGGSDEPGGGDGDGDGDPDPEDPQNDADSGSGAPEDPNDDPSSNGGRGLFGDATAPEEPPCMCTLPGAQTPNDAGAVATAMLVAMALLRRRRPGAPQTTTGHRSAPRPSSP